MKKKLSYIIFLLKSLIFAKWDFSYPKHKKILLIDGLYNPFLKYFKTRDFNILYRRGEKINIPIIFHCLKEFELTSINYFAKYVKFSKPKIILTAFDHYPIFYKLSKKTGVKTFMLQRGKRTWEDGIFANKAIIDNKNNRDNYVDYIFTHTKKTADVYKTFINGKYKVIGSFENNSQKNSKRKKKREILYISNIKFDNNNKPMPLNKFDHIIIKKLFELSKKNLLKFNIMGRHINEKTKLEINYYNKLLGNNINFINKNENKNSYLTIKKFEYIFTDYSTMGVEALTSGSKVGFIFFKPNEKKFFDLRLGKFEGLGESGPFWTAFSEYDDNEVNRIFHFVTKSNNIKWSKIRRFYSKIFMEYDEGNKIFLKIIKKTLKK